MKRLLMATLALATFAAPIAASAQSRGDRRDYREARREFRDDRQDFRQDRRALQRGEITRDQFRAERRDFRGDRQDFREARREFRDDRRDDRRRYARGYNYSRPYYGYSQPSYSYGYSQPYYGGYYSQPSYGYGYGSGYGGGYYGNSSRWYRGAVIPYNYRRNWYINDYNQYGYGAPPRGYGYYRTDTGDIVLAAIATGVILSILGGR